MAPIRSNEHACTKLFILFIFLESEVCLAHPKLLASLQLTILPLQESFKNIEHKRFSFQISLFSQNSPAFVSSPQNCSAGIFPHGKKVGEVTRIQATSFERALKRRKGLLSARCDPITKTRRTAFGVTFPVIIADYKSFLLPFVIKS